MIDTIITLEEDANASEVLEICENLGLNNARIYKSIGVITGLIPENMYDSLAKIIGVKAVDKNLRYKTCCGDE